MALRPSPVRNAPEIFEMNPESPVPASLVDVLSLHAAQSAARPALYYFDSVMTYGTLAAESDALACALRNSGFSAGERFALFLQNEPAVIVATFAVW